LLKNDYSWNKGNLVNFSALSLSMWNMRVCFSCSMQN
jgi:hypothetical protein